MNNSTSAAVIADGDSITYGSGLSPLSKAYPPVAALSFANISWGIDIGVPAQNSAQLVSRLSQTNAYISNQVSSVLTKIIYTIMVGTNDPTASIPASTTYANIQSICSSVKTAGATGVVVFTILPFGNEGYRQTLNTLIRAGGACTYTLADVGNDPNMGQAGQQFDATYYQSDHLHPNDTGAAVIATYMATALTSLGVQ